MPLDSTRDCKILSCLFIAILLHALPACATEPDLAHDTISPAYDWKTFPYSWDEICAGKLPITPVHWNEYAKNPVVNVGMNSRPILWDDQTVRVYYGVRSPGKGIYYIDVDAAAPEKILAGPTGPIIKTGPKGSHDEAWLISPEPVRLEGGHMRMYYSGFKGGAGFFNQKWSLSVAESHDDGKTWEKYSGNPILKVGKDRWESGAIGFCSVFKEGPLWKMWYLGTTEDAIKQVGYATSSDGLNWKRYENNPVIPVNPDNRWEKGAIAVPRVIRQGKLYKVWYCCYEKNNTYAIGCAESVDGIDWRRSPHNPVRLPEGKGFASKMVAYPGVVNIGDRYLMWYSGNGYGNAGLGLATATAPEGKLLYRTGKTSLPEESWSAWSPVSTASQQPDREGNIQFAIVIPTKE